MKLSMDMIKRFFPNSRASLLLVALLCISQLSLRAQEKDFATWANVGLEYKVKPAFAVSGGLEWRTKDDLSKTDRWGLNIGGAYTLLPFLKVGAGYELHYRNRGEAGWKFRQRYYFDGTLSTRIQDVKLSLRERFQHTFEKSNNEYRLRSQFKVAYDVPDCILEPYVSVEIYNGLNAGDRFDVKRMRYRGGIALPLSDRWKADVFYCRQWEQKGQKNIFGLTCNYSF